MSKASRTIILAFALVMAVLIAALVLLDWGGRSHLARVVVTAPLFSLVLVGLVLPVVLYGRKELILDERGIWLTGRRRTGILWSDIQGYEWPKRGLLRVWDKGGRSLLIPSQLGIDIGERIGPVIRILDRRVGPDGHRPIHEPSEDSLVLRLRHHYGNIPAVEIEPGVVYRYTQPERIASELRASLFNSIVSAVCAAALCFYGYRMGQLGWTFLLLAVLMLAGTALVLFRDIRL